MKVQDYKMLGRKDLILAFITSILIIGVFVFAYIMQPVEKIQLNDIDDNDEDNSIVSEEVTCESELIHDEVSTVYISVTADQEDNEQYVKSIMQKTCKRYPAVVLNITAFNFAASQNSSISTYFLEAVLTENDIRQADSLKALQIYLYVPAKIVLDLEVMNAFLRNVAKSGVFFNWNSIITGLVFDSSIFPIPYEIQMGRSYFSSGRYSDAPGSAMGNVYEFMEFFRVIFGSQKIQMGLSVSQSEESEQCVTILFKATKPFLSRVDLILYNQYQHSAKFDENVFSEMPYGDCRRLVKGKIYYRVRQGLQN